MAHLHFKRTVYRSGSGASRARIAYITRQPVRELGQGEQRLRYIQGDHEDLLYTNSRNLPAWAHGKPHAYFAAAETHEGVARVAFEEWKMSLPKELTHSQNMQLTRDLMDSIAGDAIPVVYALHAPATLSASGEQPHLHLLLSSRRTDEHRRTPAQHFRRWNRAYPERGGAQKDAAFWHQGAVKAWRVTITDVINLHLAHHGHEGFVHPESLKARQIDRQPEPKLRPSESQAYRERGEVSPRMQTVLALRTRSAFERQNELRTTWAYWLRRQDELGITNAMSLHDKVACAVAARRVLVDHPPNRRPSPGERPTALESQHRQHQQRDARRTPPRAQAETLQALQRGLRRLAQRLQGQEAGSALNVRIPHGTPKREEGMGL
jgi:hypothetical protein